MSGNEKDETTNCAFGGRDLKTLFVTGGTDLLESLARHSEGPMALAQARTIGGAVTLLAVCGVNALCGGDGFGTVRKKKVDLLTRQPAVVRLANTSIAFTRTSINREYAPVEGSLEATLETELIGNEKTLVKKNNPAEADWVLGLKITGFATPPPHQRIQNNGKFSTTFVRWNGSLNVSYQVLDHAGRVHDAGNVSYSYDKEFDSNTTTGPKSRIPIPIPIPGRRPTTTETVPHSTEDVKQILIKQVVLHIANQLGNTTKVVEAQIATGDEHLNRAADFMERQLWVRALDELEKAPAAAKPEDESYHQYDLGLVYEAMAYDSKNAPDQRANIFKAAEYYDKALELHPKEKYFMNSVARTKDAIARYKALDLMQQEDRKLAKKGAAARAAEVNPSNTKPPYPTPAAPKSHAVPVQASKTLTANDVIEMFTAGVPQEQIADMIRNSPVEYDYRDKDTALAIAKAKLPVRLQNELRKRVGAAPLGATAPAKKTPAAAPKKP